MTLKLIIKILLAVCTASIIITLIKLIKLTLNNSMYKTLFVQELLDRGFTADKLFVKDNNIYLAIGEITIIRITIIEKLRTTAVCYALGFTCEPEDIIPDEVYKVKELLRKNINCFPTTKENLAKITLALLDIDKEYKETPRHIDKKML